MPLITSTKVFTLPQCLELVNKDKPPILNHEKEQDILLLYYLENKYGRNSKKVLDTGHIFKAGIGRR